MEAEKLANKILKSMPKCDPLEQTIKIARFIPKLKKWVNRHGK